LITALNIIAALIVLLRVGLAPAFGTDRAPREVCTHRGAGALDRWTAALSRTSHYCASNDAAAAAQVCRRLAPGQRLFRDRDAAVLRRQSRIDRTYCAPVYPDQTLLDADPLSARAYNWFIPWKDAVFAQIRSSWVWRYGRMLKRRIKLGSVRFDQT
jgi:hypothetical protein